MKRTLIVLIATVCLWGAGNLWAADIKAAIVKIYTVKSQPNYYNPWNSGDTGSGTGSGAIITGRKILTNAHVVSDATFIQVRRHGQPRRYNARVQNVSHEADLALLTVDDPDFFTGSTSLELDALPDVQQEISVYGFPMGGDTMSITKGVVSRVEHQVYTHSGLSLLAIQIDAPINPGNSGGPAIINGRIAGVAMMGFNNTSANSIGYIVPTPIIKHFFDDIADGRQDGFPALGVTWQSIENPDMKRRYQVSDKQEGVLVLKTVRGGSAAELLREGDVITGVDDQPVAGDGTVELRKGERTCFSLVIQGHQIGDKVKVDFIRNGQPQSAQVTLINRACDNYLAPLERHDVRPTYYMFGGLVFCPLTVDLVRAWGGNWNKDAPIDFLEILAHNEKRDTIDEVVVLLSVMAGDLTQGYLGECYLLIKKVNGHEIRNLREMITIIENSKDQFIGFEARDGGKIVLDRQRCIAEQPDILKTYQIARDRSVDLLVPAETGKSK